MQEQIHRGDTEYAGHGGDLKSLTVPGCHLLDVLRKITVKFCVAYGKFNVVTVPNTYPLPRVDNMLDSLFCSKYFSTFDFVKVYWQIPLHENAQKKNLLLLLKCDCKSSKCYLLD